MTVRGAMFGVAIMGLAGVLAGCVTDGNKGETGTMAKPPSANFEIKPDTNDATSLLVDPDDGDASLEVVEHPRGSDNKIVWHADFPFGIKFVQIDDPTKKPKKKFGPNQKDDWNTPICNANNTSCTLTLDLDPKTSSGKNKEIRAAKYIVASPSGCSDADPIPATCKHLDPIIIVRY